MDCFRKPVSALSSEPSTLSCLATALLFPLRCCLLPSSWVFWRVPHFLRLPSSSPGPHICSRGSALPTHLQLWGMVAQAKVSAILEGSLTLTLASFTDKLLCARHLTVCISFNLFNSISESCAYITEEGPKAQRLSNSPKPLGEK